MKKLLIIDDDPSIRRAFHLATEGLEIKIDEAENGKIGAEKAILNDYDLIFLDLKMPVMTGVETLKFIRHKKITTPIRIITAFIEEHLEELEEASKENLSFQIVRKPISNSQLRSLIESVVLKKEKKIADEEPLENSLTKLTLYIFGDTEESKKAIAQLNKVINKTEGTFNLEVIDLANNPSKVNDDIIATPTLIKTLPPPVRQIIGELDDDEEIISVLIGKKKK